MYLTKSLQPGVQEVRGKLISQWAPYENGENALVQRVVSLVMLIREILVPTFRVGVDFLDVRRNLTPMKTVVSSKGQVVLPIEIRERDRIVAGQKFEIERLDAGEYLLKRREYAKNEGLVDWLQECPEKNWYQPVESESTDTL